MGAGQGKASEVFLANRSDWGRYFVCGPPTQRHDAGRVNGIARNGRLSCRFNGGEPQSMMHRGEGARIGETEGLDNETGNFTKAFVVSHGSNHLVEAEQRSLAAHREDRGPED